MFEIKKMNLSEVPDDVISLTRPGASSVMKMWLSEARTGFNDGLAWLAYDRERLVGWAAVVDGEISVYVRPGDRQRGVGTELMEAIGDTTRLVARPHNLAGERFFEPFDIDISP